MYETMRNTKMTTMRRISSLMRTTCDEEMGIVGGGEIGVGADGTDGVDDIGAEGDCGVSGVLEGVGALGVAGVVVDVEDVRDGVGVEGGGDARSKISTISESPVLLNPPPKKILFLVDVDASPARASLNVVVNQLFDVMLYTSTIELVDNPSGVPPPNITISPIDDNPSKKRG
jgi:hypothetical protein